MENTFGSYVDYKTLPYIEEQIELLPKNKRTYIVHFLNTFNLRIIEYKIFYNNVGDLNFKKYVLSLIRKDYISKVDGLKTKYNSKLVSYIRNFILTKLKQVFKNIEN